MTHSVMDNTAERICIDGRRVGLGEFPYVIAEAGVNHNGDESTALRLVDAASDAGVDAVKFQMFTAETLTTAAVATAPYQASRTHQQSQRQMLASLELSGGAFRRIARHCGDRGIAFLATPFTVDDLEKLLDVGTAAVKIASTDIVDVRLLDQVCRANRPVILSTGAADEVEIAAAVSRLRAGGAGDRLVLLHCVSAYPTPLGCANLAAIRTLRDRFSTIVGLSDHTTSTLTGALAVSAGACVLEKHFTLDAGACGPDHSLSLEPGALREYVALVRSAHEAMGDGRLAVQSIERDVRRVARKSVVAARDIAVDETLALASLTTKRAGSGMTADRIDGLIGKRAVVAIDADTPIKLEMLE